MKTLNLELDQIVTCSHTFQAKIVGIHEIEQLIEFVYLDTGKRAMLPMSAFAMLMQTLH